MSVLKVSEVSGPSLFSRDSALRHQSRSLEEKEIGEKWLQELVADMFETLYFSPAGVGMAAPQIGMLIKLIVIDVKRNGKRPLVLINPRIVDRSDEMSSSLESCMSVPGLKGTVERSESISIEYLSFRGRLEQMECEGFLSKVVQHEMDHLDGVLYVDRVGESGLEYDAGYANSLALKVCEGLGNVVSK